jgi:poly(hydroxyalkanoate) granule-associated protein
MPKTTAKKAPARRVPRKHAAGTAAPTSRQGWPTALAKAQQEGASLFESILKQGQRLEQRTKQAAVDTATAARGAATAKAREMQQIAGGTWDKLEQVFEDRVARALSKLGIYTQNDIQRLADRVDELSAAVNRLQKAKGAAAKRAKKR